jgi:hypothetical protein
MNHVTWTSGLRVLEKCTSEMSHLSYPTSIEPYVGMCSAFHSNVALGAMIFPCLKK